MYRIEMRLASVLQNLISNTNIAVDSMFPVPESLSDFRWNAGVSGNEGMVVLAILNYTQR